MSSFHPGFELRIEQLCELFTTKNKRYFVDIGAHDGITGNNTIEFEKKGWEGVCIEPLPDVFEDLVKNRTCKVECCAIWKEEGTVEFMKLTGYPEMLSGITVAYDPRHIERIHREVKDYNATSTLINVSTKRFDQVVDRTIIDFLSIDTEGSEISILETVDFSHYDIHVIAIENNFMDPAFEIFFRERGYRLDSTHAGCDQVYVKNKYE